MFVVALETKDAFCIICEACADQGTVSGWRQWLHGDLVRQHTPNKGCLNR